MKMSTSKEFIERSNKLDAENRRLEQQLNRLRAQMENEKVKRQRSGIGSRGKSREGHVNTNSSSNSSSNPTHSKQSIGGTMSRRGGRMPKVRASSADKQSNPGRTGVVNITADLGGAQGGQAQMKPRPPNAAPRRPSSGKKNKVITSKTASASASASTSSSTSTTTSTTDTTTATTSISATPSPAENIAQRREDLLRRLKEVEEEEKLVRMRQSKLEKFEKEVTKTTASASGMESSSNAPVSPSIQTPGAEKSKVVPREDLIEIKPMWELPGDDDVNAALGLDPEPEPQGGKLLEGDPFDERKAADDFKAALAAWRGETTTTSSDDGGDNKKSSSTKNSNNAAAVTTSSAGQHDASIGISTEDAKPIARRRPMSARRPGSRGTSTGDDEGEHMSYLAKVALLDAGKSKAAEFTEKRMAERRATIRAETEAKIKELKALTDSKIKEAEERAAREEQEELERIRRAAEEDDEDEYYSTEEEDAVAENERKSKNSNNNTHANNSENENSNGNIGTMSNKTASTADDGGGELLTEFLLEGIRDVKDDEEDEDMSEEGIADMVSRAMSVAESIVYGDVDEPTPRSRPTSAMSSRPTSAASTRSYY